jgi:WD40-like Beta Propeller Repeat
MRRAVLLFAVVAAVSSVGTAWSACDATIGTSAIPLTASGDVFSLGLDGSVRPGVAPTAGTPPGSVDPSGRYTATWKQGGQSPLVLLAGGKAVTIAAHVAGFPVWRPKGDALAFGQLVTGAIRLRIAEIGSRTRVRQLRVALCALGGPAWSPDGRYLALVSPNDQRHCERGSQLVVVDAQSGKVTAHAPIADPVPTTPVWSSDGAFAAESGVLGTSGVAIVPRTPRLGTPRLVAGCANAVWSPHGARLAATCGSTLALVDARTGSRTDMPITDVAPGPGSVWSPDGSRIAATTQAGIAIATTDGRTRTLVPVAGCWAGRVLGFSRDGRALVRASIAPAGD